MTSRTFLRLILVGAVAASVVLFAAVRWRRANDSRGVNVASETFVSTQETETRFGQLSAESKEVARRVADPVQREFAITALWASEQPRLTADELAPFVSVLERCRTSISQRELLEDHQTGLETNRVMQSVSQLADSWVDGGPYPELRGDLLRLATKCSAHPDHWVRVYSASLILVVRDCPPSEITLEAQRALDRLFADKDAQFLAERYAKIAYERNSQRVKAR